MNKIIYKYPLEFTYPQTIKLPSSAKFYMLIAKEIYLQFEL